MKALIHFDKNLHNKRKNKARHATADALSKVCVDALLM